MKRFYIILAVAIAFILVGVASIILSDSFLGPDFGGYVLTADYNYVDNATANELNSRFQQVIRENGIVIQSEQYVVDMFDEQVGIIITMQNLTDTQIKSLENISFDKVSSVQVAKIANISNNKILIWSIVGLGIVLIVLFVEAIVFAGKLNKKAIILSGIVTLSTNLLVALATSAILTLFGINFNLASIGAIFGVVAFSAIMTSILIVNLTRYDENTSLALLKAPFTFATLIIVLMCIGFAVSGSIYVIACVIPLLGGSIFALLTNLYMFLPMWTRLSNK